MESDNNIIVYNSIDGSLQLDVKLDNDTVWLTQAQMAVLFDKNQSVIARHIQNAFKEEVDKDSNMHILHNTISKYKPTAVYSLDVIISVGYRVKSVRGVEFRRWATKVLKDYLLKGYAVNSRLNYIEDRFDRRLSKTEMEVEQLNQKMDFFIKTSLPPQQGIFYEGQVFDAYTFVSSLIKGAKREILLIDNYIDETVLTLLDKRKSGVSATIYTAQINRQLQLDITRHNSQFAPIVINTYRQSHDRFLCIDEEVYHIGASIKDLGKKWFAFAKMYDLSPIDLLNRINGEI